MLGHDVSHELLRLVVDVIGVDQDVADVVVEVVADGADHQARLLVNQERTFGATGTINGCPQFEQVVQVPLQLGGAAANAGGAGNDGHAIGVFQLVHGFFELCAVVALDATADTAAPWVVGHEHHIATGQRDERGEGRAFVAALFLFHLDQHFLTLFDHILDAGLGSRHIAREILFGDFFERQKAVTFFTIVDETSLKRRFDAGDHGLVNIAFALFAPFNFDFVVEEFLSVDDGQAALFGLGGIDQHPFHDAFLFIALQQHRSVSDQRCRKPMLEKETGNRTATGFGASAAPTLLRGRGGRDANTNRLGLGHQWVRGKAGAGL